MEVNRVWIIEKGNSRWKIGEFIDDVLVNVTRTDGRAELKDFHLPKPHAKGINILLTGSGNWTKSSLELLNSRGNVTQFRHGDSHPLKTTLDH